MSMSFKDRYVIAPGFESMFDQKDLKDILFHEALIIQMKILSAMENSFTHPISKKDLASKLNTSPSYITQLYRGDNL